MENFVLENPTKIIFGRHTIKSLGAEAAALGRKAILVYGRGSIKKNGIYNDTNDSLRAAGLAVVEHGGVKSNPALGFVREGIELARRHNVDMVIAVGGGSVIDTAKAISAGAVVEHDVWKFFSGKKGVTSPLPLGCVLTIAASGSEMNGGMVITNEEKGLKLGAGNKKLCPRFAILDPGATFSVPPDYTAYGAVDAISHILEFYFTCQGENTGVQDRFMEGLVINLMEACDISLLEPHNYPARANLMWCATMALNGWVSAGLGWVGFPMHMIEHSMSAIYDVPHGAGLSAVIPAWMRWQIGRNPAKLAQFGRRVFAIAATDDVEAAGQGIERLKSWFVKINSPTSFVGLDIPRTAIPALAANSQTQAKIWRLREYDQAVVSEILGLIP
ncbi:MAG: iron-containing alcohol dehydrogenase [Deltaproteobacteria bacterium]|nr:iron-containing alcohol dehydrogenase [Deltaproteobacteria bacterium]